jgi:hypothetical protein
MKKYSNFSLGCLWAGVMALALPAATAAPVIVSVPAGTLNLLAGGSPTFRVKATGTAPFTYEWKKGGAPISGNPSAATDGLTIQSASAAASGSYTVTVTDATGPATSAAFTLNFTAPPSSDRSATNVMADGPSAFWRFNEASGSTIFDVAGGMNASCNATRVDRNITATSGIAPDKATRFKAVTDGISASVPYSPNINAAGAFSVECWAKPDVGGNTGKAVLSTQNRNAGRSGYVIYQGNGGNYWDAHLGSGGSFVALTTRTPIAAGRWDHIVLTVSAPSVEEPVGLQTANLYINGFLEKSVNLVLPFRNNEAAALEFGSRSGGTLPWPGSLDEVAYYNYELTPDQVAAHFSITYVGAVIVTPPVALTNAEEGSTITLTANITGFPNTYEWLRDGNPLDYNERNPDNSRKYPNNVNGPSLTISQALPQDSGNYVLRVSNPLVSVDTPTAVVNVALDTTPPQVVSVTSKALNIVRVTFDSFMTPDAMLLPENYQFSGGVTATRISPTSDAGVYDVTIAGMTRGQSYTMSISGVTDARTNMNPIGPNSTPFTANGLSEVNIFTGGEEGEGLDLDGNFRYAFNFGTNGAAGLVRDANFTSDSAPGITWSAANEIANWSNPQFGETPFDDAMEKVMQSIRWSVGPSPVSVNLSGLVAGTKYKLQLFFTESCCAGRGFDILAEGVLVLNDFLPAVVLGGIGSAVADRGVVITHEFTAADNTLNIQLSSVNIADPSISDRNPTLNGGTLEILGVPAPDLKAITGITRLPGSVTLTASGTASKVYAIDYSTDLQTWTNANNSFIPGTNGTGTWTDTAPARTGPSVLRSYYRLRDPLLKPQP